MTADLPRLTAAQVAARLDVRIETVYAYVSRGLLTRSRDRAGSWFDPMAVEAFATARRRSRRPGSQPPVSRGRSGAPLMVIDTDVAHVEDGELLYRDRTVDDLSRGTFEDVVSWLWDAPEPSPNPAAQHVAASAAASLPADSASIDRLRVATATLGAHDALRHQSDADNLARIGWTLLGALPSALGTTAIGRPASSVAHALALALQPRSADAGTVRAIDTALIVAIDHDLAASTFAARVAASARADGYSIVQAALGAFDSPLHGAAPRSAARLIARTLEGVPADAALSEAAHLTGSVPGFGHPLYEDADPRAALVLPLLRSLREGPRTMAAVEQLAAAVARRTELRPNIDLALAALAVSAGMPEDAGTAIFAIGRIAGWVSHARSEYTERPLRLRPRGNYIGP